MVPRLSKTLLLLLVAGLVLNLEGAAVLCAADEKVATHLDRDTAGLDYQLQGEFRGFQRFMNSERSSTAVALQVVALGDGNFEAVKFYTGLPGEKPGKGDRFEYSGKVVGDVLRLWRHGDLIEIDGKSATLWNSEGVRYGELQKVDRSSPTLGALPPAGAIVLFDGSSTQHFVGGKITPEGVLREGATTKDAYGDCRIHLEFLLPFKPLARGQDRGNSGLYIQGRYELQMLDSFGLKGEFNECGSLYRIKSPDVNMCYPPLVWQSYDVDFKMPKFDEKGQKIADARFSVWQNGVLIQNDVALKSKTGAGLAEGPEILPTKIQDHANPVLFRNIWLVPGSDENSTPATWVQLPLKGPPVPYAASVPPLWVQMNSVGNVSFGPRFE
ncbi:3-keto-disaccharide hydrolase [Planctomicrobium sp. SH668]|uniref:3-keto-disaccharide hydrolase n=1 Tax=Planctomicrobium sp. SH668 TaxID=3448126 RepID=UPI003F5B049C